jgi:hypothetical protein
LPTATPSWRALPSTRLPVRAGDGQRDLPLLGVHPAPVDGLAEDFVDVDHLGVGQRVVALQPGQVDDLSH